MEAAGITDRGKIRDNNEDSFLIYQDGPFSIFAVADGMGGHAAGEVASALALDTIREFVAGHRQEMEEGLRTKTGLRTALEKMLELANLKIMTAGGQQPECAGMGTTLTFLFGAKGEFWLSHIGDSRAYLLRDGDITQLTEDHTLVKQLVRTGQITEDEMNGHPRRHILTRALGGDGNAVFDIERLTFQDGDMVLLCTDGLYSLVEDQEICDMVQRGKDLQKALVTLVERANEQGGLDNITAVLVKIQS